MPQTNKAILIEANEAISRGDYEGFLAHCSDDTVWNFLGDRILEGKKAVRQYMDEVYTEPPRFEVEDLIAENDLVTAVGKITLKEDGQDNNYDYCDVWRFRDGKMAYLRAYVVKT